MRKKIVPENHEADASKATEPSEEPQFMRVNAESGAFQKTIRDAQAGLPLFKNALKDLPKDVYACVKFFIPVSAKSKEGAYIWLMAPFFQDGHCCAQPFELPKEFKWIKVGQWLKFPESKLLDWYLLSESGELRGGYSLRYQRTLTPPDKLNDFDKRLGVVKYL